MELDTFIRALMRRWYISVVLLALAVAGVWLYQSYTRQTTAAATVVVLPPLPAPGEFVPPQFAFDQIDESSDLAERVAARLNDGTPVDEFKSRISVSVRIDPNQRSTSPLYKVSARDRDSERAILIANTATEEAKNLYAELNSYDRKDVRLAFQDEINQAEDEAKNARAEFETFRQQNDAYALPERAAQQLSLVSQLEAASLGSGAANSAVEDALAAERAELGRLNSLESEYTLLQDNVKSAEDTLLSLNRQILNIVTGHSLPAHAQVKIFDSARVETDLFFELITYALAIFVALFLAVSIVYLSALFERVPPTNSELEGAFNSPIMVQIPRQSR